MSEHLPTIDTQTPLMSWEPLEQYQTLLAELENEHAPQGVTERHLVEELALTIWRRRRLRAAEQVEILKGLPLGSGEISYSEHGRSFVSKQLQAITGRRDEELNPGEFLRLSDEEREREMKECTDDLAGLDKALALLEAGKKADYLKAIKAANECGFEWFAEDDWQSDAVELRTDLIGHKFRSVEPRLESLRHAHTIAMLATAYSYTQANTLDLMKLDLALNRKMAETLSMLARLQELRAERGEKPTA